MSDIPSEAYPQKVEAHTGAIVPAMTQEGPNGFKFGEQVLFMRLGKVLTSHLDGNRLLMECETRGSLNRTAQTHETRMHQSLQTGETGACMVEIHCWSPAIFRVRFSEITLPREEPAFPEPQARMLVGVPDESMSISFEEDEHHIMLRTGEIAVRIHKDCLLIEAFDAEGQLFWQQCRSELFTSDIFDMAIAHHDGTSACFESFMLAPQEDIYGLGERFDHVARRGKAVDFWNKDAIGTSNTRSYINVPFLLSTRGYGLFLNSSSRTEWEVGTLEASALGFGVEDAMMDYFIIHGPTPAEILYRYSTLTGFSPTPPIWSFGLWMSRNSYWSWDVVHDVAQGIRSRGIPADVLHLDTAWFQEDWNCDLRFSDDRFADPATHMQRLRDEGFRVSLWQYNFVPARENNINFREGVEKGYFALDEHGKPYTFGVGDNLVWGKDVVIDFSNPRATGWYTEQIQQLIQLGAATIKTDFGEGIPADASYQRIEGRKFHNLYSLVYNSAIAEAIHQVSGEYIVWARSGTAGSQRYPVHWGGDSQCNWSGLAGTVRGALSMGLSGFPFFSHDIGGFIGRPSSELYIRWAQFGLFSSHARCHGCGNDNSREPWTFGDDAYRIFAQYDRLRYRLLPYLYHQSLSASHTAKPVVRALIIDYPHDRNVWHIDDQYLFGDALLVAPVLAPMAEATRRTLYLPAGVWIDYWSKEVLHSRGEWIVREIDLQTMPIYVKAGSIIPYGEEKQSTGNEIGSIALLEVYRGAAGALQYDDGVTRFDACLEDGALSLTCFADVPPVDYFG